MTTYSAGDYTDGGVKRTCILDEGTITVTSRVYGIGGGSAKGFTFGSEIQKGQLVTVSTDTANTWANTNGMILVEAVTDGDNLCVGVVISEPEWVIQPPSTTAADTLAERLAGQYYRVATVWFPTVIAMTKATLKTADSVAVTPGLLSCLNVSVTQCGAGTGIVVNDITGSAGCGYICSMHYQAKAASTTVPIMIAFIGGFLTCATGV
jgi:hypothetical protein